MTKLPIDASEPGRDWLGWSVRVALVVYLSPVLLVVLLIGGVSTAAIAIGRLRPWWTSSTSIGARRGAILALKSGVATQHARARPLRRDSRSRN